MGTDWSLRAVLPPPGAAEGVQAALDLVVAQMSQWEAASDLTRFNRGAAGVWHEIPVEFAHVVAAALQIARASDGAFDPGLGNLTEAWGFGSAGPIEAVPEQARTPDRTLDFDPATRRIRRGEGAALDLSGIAKGYGVDLAAEWLLANGLRHFLLEVGGELRGEGIRPDGQPWWVDVETPPGVDAALLRIALHGMAVATSGDYRRNFVEGGATYAHTIDPRTGAPAINHIVSVTVLHRNCAQADALASVLTVLDVAEGQALRKREGLVAHMLTR